MEERIRVNAKSGSYEVIIGEKLHYGKLLSERRKKCRVLLVSDDTVWTLYGEKTEKELREYGFEINHFVFNHGEQSKNWSVLGQIVEQCAQMQLTKADLLVALGGGVVGDITGFAAAIYLRGMDYVQLPTTLLAAVDSSVGGKTAVDLDVGKNLVGAFHQPIAVLCDTDTFRTLPDEIWADGMAEVIKYGAIRDEDLLCGLEAGTLYTTEICSRCVRMKASIVEEDEFDTGLRRILNFGHTLGHGVEALSEYRTLHGCGVAIGMVLITQASEMRGELEEGSTKRIVSLLEKYHLPTQTEYSIPDLLEKAMSDKKRNGNRISIVTLKRMGWAEVKDMSLDEFRTFFPKREIKVDIMQKQQKAICLQAISSKSYVHRLLIAAALADKETKIKTNILSKDMEATIRCLTSLGTQITVKDNIITVTPAKGVDFCELDCGESGSTARFLLPVSMILAQRCHMEGSGKLPQRPFDAVCDAMEKNGAVFTRKHLPMEISGRLKPGCYVLPGNISSQYISGLLFALPLLQGNSKIMLTTKVESQSYVDMTIEVLKTFGIQIEEYPNEYRIAGNQVYRSMGEVIAEGDWSNAAFFLCMGALKGSVTMEGLNLKSLQGDREVLALLEQFGAQVERSEDRVTVREGVLKGISADVSQIPDLVPVLAMVAANAKGKSIFYHAERLRMKESDRIQSIRNLLTSLGGIVTVETKTGHEGTELHIYGQGKLHGGIVDGAGDHRIVMAAASVASVCEGTVTVLGTQAVEKSYPTFWEDYKKLFGEEVLEETEDTDGIGIGR